MNVKSELIFFSFTGSKESLSQLLVLGLLNHVDCSDLFTEAARLIKENNMHGQYSCESS